MLERSLSDFEAAVLRGRGIWINPVGVWLERVFVTSQILISVSLLFRYFYSQVMYVRPKK